MYLFIHALILALLLASEPAQKTESGLGCRAELNGTELVTTLKLPNGTALLGPWRVLHTGEDEARGDARFVVFAALDHMYETDEVTGERQQIRFPQPVRLVFEGATRSQALENAARVWCVSVMRARENQHLEHLSPEQAMHTRIAVVPLIPGAA